MAAFNTHPEPAKPTSYMGVWIVTLILIVGFVFTLLLYPPLDESPEIKGSDQILMVGRFHPILVHLPIGALILLIIMELASFRRSLEEKFAPAALLALWVGAAGSAVAVIAGIFLSREGGYGGGNFSLHQTMGIIGTCGILLSLVLRIIAMSQENRSLLDVYRAILFISFGIMSTGAHFGANMVHGSKYLTQFAPPAIAEKVKAFESYLLSWVDDSTDEKEESVKPESSATPPAPPAPAASKSKPQPKPKADAPDTASVPPAPMTADAGNNGKTVFQHVILPILEEKCNNCHNEEKAKGDLAMHTYEAAMTTGDSAGESFIPGKPDDSLSIVRIGYPEDDDEHMPPEGKTQLTESEIAILRWWIEQGASDKLTVAEATFPAETQSTVDELLKLADQNHP